MFKPEIYQCYLSSFLYYYFLLQMIARMITVHLSLRWLKTSLSYYRYHCNCVLLEFCYDSRSPYHLYLLCFLLYWLISQMYRWYIICNFYHVLFIYLQFFFLYIYFISIYINTYFPMCVLNFCYTFRSWLDLLRLRQNVSCQRLV